MFRFPNPGSDINRCIAVFKKTFSGDQDAYYKIEKISKIMANNESASAVGSMGKLAYDKSQKKDKTRNSIYNQAKAYVELYRWLGWLYASNLSSVKLTAIGKMILSENYESFPIFLTCFLCWNTPNENIKSTSKYKGYPILNILCTASKLDGKITRDEIILGPLNEKYEKNASSVSYLKKIRKENCDIKKELSNTKIAINTQKNYTRFVLAGLKYTKLMKKVGNEYVLTSKGKKISDKKYDRMLFSKDINDRKKILEAFCWFLKNSGFKVNSFKTEYKDNEVFGSPYQVFKPKKIDQILINGGMLPEDFKSEENENLDLSKSKVEKVLYKKVNSLKTKVDIVNDSSTVVYIDNQATKRLICKKSTQEILKIIGDYKKNEFYPFIGDLFKILGFKVCIPPSGRNAVRADIVLKYDKNRVIPVEVKSKTEVSKINIKAVEQAIENKIILEAQKNQSFEFNDSTFVVGFDYPTSIRENQLINACDKIYKIKVALFSVETLIKMARKKLNTKKEWNIEKMITGKGTIEID